MAWHQHGRQRVYYRSRRIGERVHRTYVGAGEVGLIAERVDRCLRRERKRQQSALQKTGIALRNLLTLCRRWEGLNRLAIHAHLLVHGFYQHHRHAWRRRIMTAHTTAPSTIRLPTATTENDLRQLVDEANSGDADALAALRDHLQRYPHVVDKIMDLEFQCREQALDLICEQNAVVREALRVKLDRLEAEVGGPHPSVSLRLAARRVSLAWLTLLAGDLLCGNQFSTGAVPKRWLDYRESAERRYFAALKSLEGVRKILGELASR